MTSTPRRLGALALGAIALLTSSCEPGTRGPAIAAPVAATGPVPALWKVADADTTIYLFGTIHVLPEPVDWNTGAIAAALAGSDTLVTEAIIDDQAALQQAFLAKRMRTDGQSLRATMTPDNRAKYEAAMRKLGLPEAAFDPLKAWFPAIALPSQALRDAGYALDNGVETQLVAYAKARGLARDALETPAMQMDAFDSLSPAVQLSYLAQVVDQLPETGTVVGQLVSAWKSGQADELARVLNDDEDNPAVRDALLIRRNANWARWIEARLAKPGTVFVAVGAGHLAGAGSVQQDLAAEGLTIKRVQ